MRRGKWYWYDYAVLAVILLAALAIPLFTTGGGF